MDVESLTDDEIRSRLTEAGIPVGPILDSTRSVYVRKLQRLAGDLSDVQFEEDDSEEEDHEEVPPSPPAAVRQRPMTAKVRTPPKASGDEMTGEVKAKRQQRKLDVPISKEVTESSGGGITGLFIKLIIFIVILAAVFYFIGLSYDEAGRQALASDSE